MVKYVEASCQQIPLVAYIVLVQVHAEGIVACKTLAELGKVSYMLPSSLSNWLPSKMTFWEMKIFSLEQVIMKQGQ